ncbi:hypothetical protein [Litorivivens sp.]|uniref:hypothetical protein n=1 Tax=Litorivivens sp. TaxID=2020868 RepID=UPI0035648FFB
MSTLLQQALRTWEPKIITAKSGLTVDVTDDVWQLLPTASRGWTVDMSWVWSTAIPDEDRYHMLTAYLFYATTKEASTMANVVCRTKKSFSSGIPSLVTLKSRWSGLPTHQKKGLSQFFSALNKLGYKQYSEYHSFTKAHLDKEKLQMLDPHRGSLNEQEFDSFCASLNLRLKSLDWNAAESLDFFRSPAFGYLAFSVSSKLLTATVRRPVQLAMLKWSDVIPVGSEFRDPQIDPSNEIGSVGINQLQLRFFYAKHKGGSWRTTPEMYPIALTTQVSEVIVRYKRLYVHCVRLWLAENGCKVSYEKAQELVWDMPVFVQISLFEQPIMSTEDLRKLFTPESRGFHASAASISNVISRVAVESSRVKDCKVTSNRIRHTVLTRGAQAGYTATTLAKITGVTVPAARHYIDLDYESRLMIDELYVGSEFLASIFSDPLEAVSGSDTEVLDHKFNSVGGLKDKKGCTTCSAATGRPIGCYGCNNFRPILEANHTEVLELAELKLEANSKQLLSPEEKFSIEKLTKQIGWIKRTINVCNQVLEVRRGIE